MQTRLARLVHQDVDVFTDMMTPRLSALSKLTRNGEEIPVDIRLKSLDVGGKEDSFCFFPLNVHLSRCHFLTQIRGMQDSTRVSKNGIRTIYSISQ